MKSYKHLWDQFISDENIELAIRNASRGKRDRKSVKKYLDDPDLKNKIINYAENFDNRKHPVSQTQDTEV